MRTESIFFDKIGDLVRDFNMAAICLDGKLVFTVTGIAFKLYSDLSLTNVTNHTVFR